MTEGRRARRAWVSWSGGKDCALALHEARAGGDLEVTGLLTTVDEATRDVAVHGIAVEVLEAQADALGLPLHVVELPWPCPNGVYEQRVGAALARAVAGGVEAVVFGDLWLEDIRSYREAMVAGTGVAAVFPLWLRPTAEVAQQIVAVGIRAVVASVDLAQAPAGLAGRPFDLELVAGLPAGVDPCGERGELHTVVLDGPGFAHPLDLAIGPIEVRGGFAYAAVALRP